MAKGHKRPGENGYVALHEAIAGLLPQFSALCLDGNEDFVSFTIRQREAGDFIIVLKAFDDSGGPVVCFGNGFDLVSSMLGIEGTLAADRWREDKPFNSG